MDYISFCADIKQDLSLYFSKTSHTQYAVLVDENTKKHCYPIVKAVLPAHTLIEIKSGEIHKTLDTCCLIWDELTAHNFDRKALLINLGGGVIGDMGGFCAATYKRGINFINIPTTLLAQVDANIGGKLGIDYHAFKNHIGLFKDPAQIFIHEGFLKTLSERELRSGFAEMIKHHLITDKIRWEILRATPFEAIDWKDVIPHSIKVKYDIVAKDPYEEGLRKALNFGHTIGHAIESYLMDNDRGILHGEAIAVGMICESYLSRQRGYLTENELGEIAKYITEIYKEVTLSASDHEKLCEYLKQDKKNKGNEVLSTLLGKMGEAKWDEAISPEDVIASLGYYAQAYT